MGDDAKDKKDPLDPRIEFICSFVMQTMRLKVDKLQKMMSVDENKVVVMTFLNDEYAKRLIISGNNAGVLTPTPEFSSTSKGKCVYFIRKKDGPINKTNIRDMLTIGSISSRPINDLSVVVDEVFVPILTSTVNHVGWPAVVIQDIDSQLLMLRNSIAEVQGNINNRTILPLPITMKQVTSDAPKILSGEIVCSNRLRKSLEDIVMKWSLTIDEVIQDNSYRLFDDHKHPQPTQEFEFWKGRLNNLTNIFDQLRDPRVKTIAAILERCDSVYCSSFGMSFRNVVSELHEARDVTLYLTPLDNQMETFMSTGFDEVSPVLSAVMQTICLIWANSKYYCSNDRIVHLFRLWHNMIIDQVRNSFDPTNAFQCEVIEALNNINSIIEILNYYKSEHEKFRAELPKFLKDSENNPTMWSFKPRIVFELFDMFLDRLIDIRDMFETANEFTKLDKVEIGGVKGKQINRSLHLILEEFLVVYREWVNIAGKYDLLDVTPAVEVFAKYRDAFHKRCDELQRKISTQFDMAFEQCTTATQMSTLIQVLGTILQQPVIKKELEFRYNDVIRLFCEEMDVAKRTFDRGVENINRNGCIALPVDAGQPPIAGVIKWVKNLKERLNQTASYFPHLDYPVFESKEGEYAMLQYNAMCGLLSDFEKQLMDTWKKNTVDRIPVLLSKNLLLMDGTSLRENFDNELLEILREVRTMNCMGMEELPQSLQSVCEREDELFMVRQSLSRVVEWYNACVNDTQKCELDIIQAELNGVTVLLQPGLKNMTWKKYEPPYVQKIYETCKGIYDRVQKAQANLGRILGLVNKWGSVPLFARKDMNNDLLLDVNNREMNLNLRLKQCLETKRAIDRVIMDENYRLFFNIPFSCPCSSDDDSDEDDRSSEKGGRPEESGMISQKAQASFSEDDVAKLRVPITVNIVKSTGQLQLYRPYEEYVDELVGNAIMNAVLTSIRYIKFEMENRLEHNAPVFEVNYELQRPIAFFIPNLDTSDSTKSGFLAFIDEVIVDIYSMADMVARVAQPPESERLSEDGTPFVATYESILCKHVEIENMRDDIVRCATLGAINAHKYVRSYDKYARIWTTDRDVYLSEYLKYGRGLTEEEIAQMEEVGGELAVKEKPPTLDMFRDQIDQYQKLREEVSHSSDFSDIDVWLRLRLKGFKYSLLNEINKWSLLFKLYLKNRVIDSLQELEDFIVTATVFLTEEVDKDDLSGLLKVIDYLNKIETRQMETDRMFEPLKDIATMLKEYKYEFEPKIYLQFADLPDKWNKLKKAALSAKQAIGPIQSYQMDLIGKRVILFETRMKLFRKKFQNKSFFSNDCPNVYLMLDDANVIIENMESQYKHLQDSTVLFELPAPEKSILLKCRREVRLLKELWDFVLGVRSNIEDWKATPWCRIDVESIDGECKKIGKEMRLMDKEMRLWDPYMDVEACLKNLMTSLRAITELQNPAIRDRHWSELMVQTQVRIEITERTTLADLVSLNLHLYEEDIKNIVDKSVKEGVMEKVLKDLDVTWKTMDFGYEKHMRTGLMLLKTSEEMMEILEDHQGQLQNMLSSKYIPHFLKEVSTWQMLLSNADAVIDAWFEVQRKWMYLESIFIGSKDIRSQLPVDSKRFDQIDADFKELLMSVANDANVIRITNRSRLLDKLEVLQGMLILCEKALNDYLETKRLAFPRFYFISSPDLLDILSNGNQPELVCRHLPKLYDSLTKLTLPSTTVATEMVSKEKEIIPFTQKCDCSGQVEIWLNRVTDSMKNTLRKVFGDAVVSYEHNPREVWITKFPAQPALCTTQIWWSSETNAAFAILEEGYENALKDYQKKQIDQLNALIVLLLGNLTPNERQKIMTVCTIDVHSRDVVAKMIAQRIESALSFQWQCQLRHRWDHKLFDCFANICDAHFKYDNEYLGNTPRLVITPLTDRCYITLTQSLHLVMGGAPAGPAGTGKTETTKDLGKGLGVMVYVFNCSEQMDYKSCGNIYKGLAQTGAWGCFDEFNRIAVEVLSVVAVQVKSILDAIKNRKTMFNFMGEVIRLIPTVGMFITMNPGYAGRTELPENLKALFRPCAMCVPDFALISEIMLVAEGFQEARQLSRKFITLYTLCKELLSKQDHYDWGLRAIKSVLVVAGALKRSDRDRPEDQVLMRALRDFNVPKIVTEDVPIFMGLIGDLFPNLDVPRKRDVQFENVIKKSALDLSLQPEKGFVLKVVQLEELFAVRHSVFVVGFAGTGKSEVWKTLNRTYYNQKRKPYYNDLNPKAVTNDELFGIINPATREWKDGLFSVIMRDQANMGGDGPKWIVLDGDIDPMWIESLNTLMDDNKILTLASNERISLTKEMRLLFEIASLKTATPATVSRAGILYINPQDLGWNPFVASWVDTRPASEKSTLTVLFEKYVPLLLEVMKSKFKKITPISEIAMLQMTCHLLGCLLTPKNVPNDCSKDWYEIYFVFAVIWGFGSALFQDQIVDWRNEFSKWWTNEFKSVKFPSGGLVFNYYIDPESKQFMPWTKLVPSYELDPDIPLQSCLVNTAETTRLRYFMDILIETNHPVMLVGGSGSGKSVIVSDKLNSLSLNYAVTNVPFNFYTTSAVLQAVLEKPLEKKAGRVYGPPGNKKMIYFIDDMNMPEVDTYGTVQPHTLVRQFMDYEHWYDRTKLSLKDIHNCQFVSCMNPTAGSFTIDPRLQRHFSTFAVNFPGADAMFHIYHSILSQHIGNPMNKFAPKLLAGCDDLIKTAIALHQRMNALFLPTAVKFHYNFSMRDLANIFSGMMFANGDCCPNSNMLIRLYVHEANRVYGDKLVSFEDLDTFHKLVLENVKKGLPEANEAVVFEKPHIYFHYAESLNDSKYMPSKSWAILNAILTEAQVGYNELVGAMNLVLFEDAMSHVCKISRILENDRGYALLIGVGGSGKQSLTRLAAFISGLDVFQTQLRKGFTVNDLKLDLAALYTKTGVKNAMCCYLMTDSQVSEEQFLVIINDLLASGEIPDLFPPDDVENIVNAVRNEVKQAGILDSKENCWKFFIEKVRRMLKIVLCFSPVGSTLRVRSRKFPAIVNCTSIDWFHEWPQNALESVSTRFLEGIEELPSSLTNSVARFMAYVHGTVSNMSITYLQNERRYNYTTPKSYLELIALYSKLLIEKHSELSDRILRLENGLLKLAACSAQVDGLQEQLKEQEVVLTIKKGEADKQHAIVSAENEKVSVEKNIAGEKEKAVRVIEEEVSVKSKLCQEDLKKAEPVMAAATAALDTLDKNNLTELKSFGSPAPAVVDVASAVLVLMCKGKIPKDRSWKACKVMMGNVNKFLDDLKFYDKKNIHPDIIKALIPYLQKPEFNSESIKSKSAAAAGLCEWVINIYKFYEVYLIVGPKERALNAAEAELNAARSTLDELNDRLNELQDKLNVLQAQLDQAAGEKAMCQAEADKTEFTIQLAHRLVDGLASEKVRWRQSVTDLNHQISTLPGDILLISCFISYVGCFTRRYRLELQNNMWLPTFKDIKPIIPVGEGADPLEMICDDAQIAAWNNEGLPSDRMSAENATILSNSARWPLMIDPQLQGIKWIKQKYGSKLVVIRLTMKTYLDDIERAVTNGNVVLLENIDETIDPVLDPLLGRALIKKGKCVKMGDKEVDYNPLFRLILHTKLANPHYKPEMQAQTTLINFTVTRDGLEEQLLAEVVKAERPDLEKLKSDLTTQQNNFKITLKFLEDDLLHRLSNAGENVLEDPTLVYNLEKTKKTAAEIEVKVAEAKITSKQIDEAREYYRVAAERASIIYFILNDLNKINRIYQFSLKAFTVVFNNAIQDAPPAEDLQARVLNLINTITFFVFMYTSRALFERDKLIFMSQMTMQILLQAKLIESADLDFLLRFPYVPNVLSPLDFISHVGWGGIMALSKLDVFSGLDKDLEGYTKRWKTYTELECPEKEKLPGEWKNKTSIQRLCIMRALRPDRMTYAVRAFVEEELGSKYVEARMMNFEQTFAETSNITHTFFTLSAGVNPLKDVEQLGMKMKFMLGLGNFHIVSLGQGQEIVAEQAIDLASEKGHWVMLQNIHLVAKWLPTLEKKIEASLSMSHPDYRLFVSAEPASSAEFHILPQGVLESAIKITNEPPTGMMANLHKSLDNFNQETLEMCSKEAEFKSILFALCYFHAVVAERRKFGPQGWNRTYPFNFGDLTISVYVLYNYLEANSKVPWEDLRYLFGEIMYGGHITDDWDRRLCQTYLEEFMQPELLDSDLLLAPGFSAPPNTDYAGFHQYIDDELPPESPYLYGLHSNAEIGVLTTISEQLFKTIFELQPRDSSSSSGSGVSKEDLVKQMIEDIVDKIPDEFNMVEIMARVEDRTPYIIVAFQECDRMNMLMREIKRSLNELYSGLKGELTITPDMERLDESLQFDVVPVKWTTLAYPSLLGLQSWFADLILRLKELEAWAADFNLPTAVWLGGFFNPQSFLTAIMQQTARRNGWPLDRMCLNCDVTKKQKNEFTAPPREGAYVCGLFMEGARWDTVTGSIFDSRLKELFPAMPVIFIKAVTQDKQDVKNIYECPVFKIRMRGPTYVWTFNLKTKEKAAKWTMAGVCLLLQV